ncbi:hypothetical protein ABH973_002414 [Bradyrhizobium ottawaense]
MSQGLLRDVVKRARHRFVRRLQFAGLVQAEERRAFLDRQLIERQMLGRFVDGETQLIGPHRRRLVGTGVDQIERIAIERAARYGDGIERLARAVQAAQRFQRGIVERLHAERDAVDAGGAIAGKARGFDAGRIRLQRHLDIAGDGPVLADRIEHRADR